MARIPDDLRGQDVIDSRDVIARIDSLREDLNLDAIAEAEEAVSDARQALEDATDDEDRTSAQEDLDEALKDLESAKAGAVDDEDMQDELAALEAFAKEGEDYSSDWSHGSTIVKASYFTEYAEELTKDIGDLPQELPSYLVIDWEATADNIKIDYTEIDFDGTPYLVR